MRVINLESKTTSFSDEHGKAVVRRDGEVYKAVITQPDGELMYEGEVPEDCNIPALSKRWQRRIWVLRKGLEQALDSRIVPVRPPRPRVIPPPATSP